MLSSYKQEIIWPDAGGLDASALIPFELGGTMQSAKPTVTVMDLGKLLLHCSREGDTDQVRDLMARGAPFTSDWLGTSPLHVAATHNHHDTCDALIKAGISKNARTKVDRTPLHFAVYEGHEDIVRLLLRHECEVDAKDMLRMTPLHWAVEKRYPRIVTELLRYGADPSCRSKFDKTPMSIALATGQAAVHQELVVAKAKIGDPEQKRATDGLMFELGRTSGGDADVDHQTTDHSVAPEMNSPLYSSGATDHLADHDRLHANGMEIDESIAKLPGLSDSGSKSGMDNPTMKILKEHGIAMLDDTDTLLNSALQSGRRLVLSDAGKLILNDPKYKQVLQTRPASSVAGGGVQSAAGSSVQNAAGSVYASAGQLKSAISPQKRQTIMSTIAAQQKLQQQQPSLSAAIATTSNGTNNIRFETMRSKKPAMFMPSKSTVGGVQQQQQSSLVAGGGNSMASTSAAAASGATAATLPLKTNKVIKILSAEEFKQMCGANAAAGSTLKKISTESFQKGALKYQTITNSNILTQLTRKKPILNKIKLGSLQQATKNSMLNEIKITGIKPIGQLQKLVPSTSTTSASASTSASYPTSGIVLDPDTEYISRLSQNQAKAAAAAAAAAATAAATATAASANNFTAYHRVAPAVASIPANASAVGSASAATAPQRLPMAAAEMERQLLELRKQTDELRKQFELSQKQAEEYRLRLEKLERERDEERAERFRNAYSDA